MVRQCDKFESIVSEQRTFPSLVVFFTILQKIGARAAVAQALSYALRDFLEFWRMLAGDWRTASSLTISETWFAFGCDLCVIKNTATLSGCVTRDCAFS